MKMETKQGTAYALIDSGASHSLIQEDKLRQLLSEPQLQSSNVSLKSVTGQKLNIKGSCEVSFQIAKGLQITHKFIVVGDSMSYPAIIGLDFLADPGRNISHELSDFVLTYNRIPVPLFNADHEQPCAAVTEIKAKGRHQYLCQSRIGHLHSCRDV